MRVVIAALLTLLALAGCEDQEVARKRNEERLPPGCRIVDLDYGDLRAAVICDGRRTTTTMRSWTETSYLTTCNANGLCVQTPVYTQHRHLTAEIGPEL